MRQFQGEGAAISSGHKVAREHSAGRVERMGGRRRQEGLLLICLDGVEVAAWR